MTKKGRKRGIVNLLEVKEQIFVTKMERMAKIFPEFRDLKKGKKYAKMRCPFHQESTPSFTFSSKGNYFGCFGCGWGGTVISYCMKKKEIGFIPAIIFLARKLKIKLIFGDLEDEQEIPF